jgi:hypothetical protein
MSLVLDHQPLRRKKRREIADVDGRPARPIRGDAPRLGVDPLL